MPNGDVIKPGVSFLDIRTWYKNDPSWPKIETALATGVAPTVHVPPVLGADRHRGCAR